MEVSTSFQRVPNEVVLDNILSRLDIATRVRFAAVCRSWRDMSRQAPPPFPCLLVPGMYNDLRNESSLYLLDPVFPTGHHLLIRRRVDVGHTVAGCYGPYLIYTLAAASIESVVYNPFSGETLRLPRKGLHPNGSAELVGYLDRAQLSSNPASTSTSSTTSPRCLVAAVASNNFGSSVCICRLGVHGAMGGGDQEQHYWIASPVLGEDVAVHDLIFHRGVLYCICESSTAHCLMAIDLHHLLHDVHGHDHDLIMPTTWLPAPRLVTILGNKEHPHDDSLQYYLVVVESASTGLEELLVATQHELSVPSTTSDSPGLMSATFRLHKVVEEVNTNSPTSSSDPKTSSSSSKGISTSTALLVEVDDLGDTILFLGKGCSRPWRWWELRNSNNDDESSDEITISEFVKKGCIYFVDVDVKDESRLGRFCVGKAGTADGGIGARFAEFLPDPLPTNFYFCSPWISPSY